VIFAALTIAGPALPNPPLILLLVAALASRPLPLWSRVSADAIPVIIRFCCAHPNLLMFGHDPHNPARIRAYLRCDRLYLSSLSQLFEHFCKGLPLLPRTIVFTVDDSYRFFADIAARVTERFDCAVTVFAITGIVDESA